MAAAGIGAAELGRDEAARIAVPSSSDTEVTVGYGLGLAFWLEQLDQSPALLRELFQRLRQIERPGGAALIAVSDAISRPQGALHHVVVERALQTLRAHQPRR